MKNQILNNAFKVLILCVVMFTGCSKDEDDPAPTADTTAPTITLTGSQTLVYSLPTPANSATAWVDPGFSASDNIDGNLTADVIVTGASSVNLNKKGSYDVNYEVSDTAGNHTHVTRTVNVVNDAEGFSATYNNGRDTCTLPPIHYYIATVWADSVNNNMLHISNFGGFNNLPGFETDIKVTLTGLTAGSPITVTTGGSESLGGTAYVTSFVSGQSFVLQGTPTTKFQVRYIWDDGAGGGTETCTGVYQR